MKEKAKRVLVFLLACSMIVGMFPSAGWATTTDSTEIEDMEELETLEETTTEIVSETTTVDTEEETGESDEDKEEEAEEVEVPLITPITDSVTNVTVEEGVDAEELKDVVVEAVFLSDGDTIDVSEYNVTVETMDALTDEVLEEANATDLVTVTYEEDEETGTVSGGTIEMDVELETVKEELEESELALTDEQIQTVLYLYSDYQTTVKNNPQYYGLQAPYLISKEDNNEDGLGILGSMLVIAGYSVDDVRDGNYSYDNLVGTIQIFAYAYSFGIEYYGDELLEVKDEVMEAVEESGAQTDAQKLLIINDWLGENVNFDMAYIMNMSSDSGDLMVAENPEENEHYEEMTASLYDTYYEQYYNQYYEDVYANGVDTDGDGTLDIQAGNGDGAAYYANLVATQAASQAAPQMAELILGAWNGNQIGVLCLGKGVCMAYTVAFGYLVQYLYPEIYGVEGATSESMESADQWKSNDDLIAYNDDGTINVEESDYVVDYVRITYSTAVSMYGVKNEEFSTQHYWNVVKVNGTWYYIDPCYMDNFTESMERARVETNGYINHIYFMVSHTTIAELYDGYYSELDTMYSELATDTTYENNTWMYYAKSNISYDDDTYYYIYNSTDLIATEEEYSGLNSNDWSSWENQGDWETLTDITSVLQGEYKLVGYEKCTKDAFEVSEDDEEEEPKYTTVYIDFSTAQVYNPQTGQMEENELIAELYAQYEEETDQYSNLGIGTSYYDGKLYFNLSNCVLTYDLESGDVVKVKEYNTVGAVRDTSEVFGALAFKVTDDLDEADLTVTNAPVTGLTIKEDEDGNPTLYVDIATNYCFISGKTDIEDTSSYGYEFQESNYNPDYNNYLTYLSSNENYSSWSAYMSEENNDNDEFMWAANFTDTISMSRFTASESSHNFQTVSVDAYCGRDAFTEERCADCGLIKDGTRVDEKGTACDHHYIYYEETYYTKDDDGNWNTGECYVCTICGHTVDSDYTADSSDYEEGTDSYEDAAAMSGHTYVAASDEPTVTWADDHSSVTVEGDVVCSVCGSMMNKYGYSLDCLCEDETIEKTNRVTTSDITVSYDGNCVDGVTAIYTATVTLDGYGELTVSDEVEDTDGQHSYVVEDDDWTWTWDEENNTYKVVATKMTCSVGDDEQSNVEAVVTSETKEATCTEDGSIVYTAVATVYGADEITVIGSATTTKTESIAALGHKYDSDGKCTRCGVQSSSAQTGATITDSSDSAGTYTVTSTGTNKTVTYTKSKNTSSTSVVIPSTITVDGMTFKVTAVSASAFKGNTKLKTVTIPSTVTTIGKSAFESCTALTAVSGCASVTKIDNRAFYGCKKLTQVGSAKSKVKLTKVKVIGSYAFYGCKSITVVNLTSKNLTKIKNYAFQNCTKLEKFVSKSAKLAKIGKKAFYGDKKLASVTLKTTKLKNSNVGAKAFTGTKKNCTFKVPEKKMTAYKTLFKKKGAGNNIKVKK